MVLVQPWCHDSSGPPSADTSGKGLASDDERRDSGRGKSGSAKAKAQKGKGGTVSKGAKSAGRRCNVMRIDVEGQSRVKWLDHTFPAPFDMVPKTCLVIPDALPPP